MSSGSSSFQADAFAKREAGREVDERSMSTSHE